MADILSAQVSKANQQLTSFHEKWRTLISKQVAKIRNMQKELVLDATANQMEVDDLSPPELSVTAQVLFDQAIQKLKQMLYEMTMEHRQIHSAISKCGKDMDRNFQADLNGLIKNEKNLEQNPENLMKANSLIFDHLVSSGMCEVAESFIKVSLYQEGGQKFGDMYFSNLSRSKLVNHSIFRNVNCLLIHQSMIWN